MRYIRDPFKQNIIKVEKMMEETIPTKISELEIDVPMFSEEHIQNLIEVPTKLSELENDVGFINKVPTNLSELNNDTKFIEKGEGVSNLDNDVGFITKSDVPKFLSELQNDTNFLTVQDIPNKISQLENDENYITHSDIPKNLSDYNDDIGFVKNIPTNLSSYNNDLGFIDESYLPTKVSQLENDIEFINKSHLPTKISELENDEGYVKSTDSITYFNTNGKITITKHFIDVFETNSSGIFTADFSSAGFTDVPKVVVSAESQSPSTDTATGNGTYVSVFKDSITTTGCSGKVKLASSAGLLAAMVNITAGAGVKVTVEALGN